MATKDYGRMRVLIIGLILSFWGIQGCVPARQIKTPNVSGTVTSKNTKKPISNALVYFDKYPENVSATDSLGHYHLKTNIGWGAWIAAGDPLPPGGVLIVKKTGCSDYSATAALRFGEFPRDKPIKLDIELDCNELPKVIPNSKGV